MTFGFVSAPVFFKAGCKGDYTARKLFRFGFLNGCVFSILTALFTIFNHPVLQLPNRGLMRVITPQKKSKIWFQENTDLFDQVDHIAIHKYYNKYPKNVQDIANQGQNRMQRKGRDIIEFTIGNPKAQKYRQQFTTGRKI